MKKISLIFILICLKIHAQHLVPYNSKGKWGYADSAGNMVIKPFTDYLPGQFEFGGYALVVDSMMHGSIIDTKGNVIVNTHQYITIDNVVKGKLIILNIGNFHGQVYGARKAILNVKGNTLIKHPFEAFRLDVMDKNRLVVYNGDTLYLYQFIQETNALRLIKKHVGWNFSYFLHKNENGKQVYYGYVIVRYTNEGNKPACFDLNGKPLPTSLAYSVSLPEVSSEPSAPMYIQTTASSEPYWGKRDIVGSNKEKYEYISNNYWKHKEDGKYAIYISSDTGAVALTDYIYDVVEIANYKDKHSTKLYGLGAFTSLQFLVKSNGKYGIKSTKELFNIPTIYDTIIVRNFYHYIVSQNGEWFVLNANGSQISSKARGEFVEHSDMVFEVDTNIVIAISTGTTSALCSNLKDIDQAKGDLKSGDNDLRLKTNNASIFCFKFYHLDNGMQNSDLCVIKGNYTGVYIEKTLYINHVKYYYVETTDGKSGYVNEFGKVFFD